MPSSILNWDTPYHILFPNKHMFPIEPRILGCACFVRDVRPHASKLDHKSLKCIFLGYSRVQKGYRCYCPSLRRYLISIDVTFLENVPFSSLPTHTRQGEEDNLFVYTLNSPIVSPKPTPVPTQLKPLITHVNTRCQHPLVSSSPLAASTSNLVLSDDLPIALRKGVSVFIQFPLFALMTICHHILVLLLHPWTLFCCLTRFLKPSLILVGIVL